MVVVVGHHGRRTVEPIRGRHEKVGGQRRRWGTDGWGGTRVGEWHWVEAQHGREAWGCTSEASHPLQVWWLAMGSSAPRMIVEEAEGGHGHRNDGGASTGSNEGEGRRRTVTLRWRDGMGGDGFGGRWWWGIGRRSAVGAWGGDDLIEEDDPMVGCGVYDGGVGNGEMVDRGGYCRFGRWWWMGGGSGQWAWGRGILQAWEMAGRVVGGGL